MNHDILEKWEIEGELEEALRIIKEIYKEAGGPWGCLLYTSPSPRDRS